MGDRDVQQSLIQMFADIIRAFPEMTERDFWFLVTAIRQGADHPNRISADKALAQHGISLPYYTADQLAWIKEVTDARIATVFKKAKQEATRGAGEQRMIARDKQTEGIRNYGPGKFYTVLDSYAYGVVMDGVADTSITFGGGDGDGETYDAVAGGEDLLDYIRKDAAETGDELTRDEVEMIINSGGVIFRERSDGIVEAEWYDTKKQYDAAVADLERQAEEEAEEQDEDE